MKLGLTVDLVNDGTGAIKLHEEALKKTIHIL